MILPIMALASLSAIYFTRLLYRKGWRTGATVDGVFYITIVLWICYIFVFDVFDFGFSGSENYLSLFYGSNIYRSYFEIKSLTAGLPLQIFEAIAVAAFACISAGVLVIIDIFFRAANVIIKLVRSHSDKIRCVIHDKVDLPPMRPLNVPILRLLCRANC